MFNFGNPEDTAALFVQNRIGMIGPDVPECPLDEMSEQDIRNVMAYLYGAVGEGLREGLAEEVMAFLTEWYDAAFQALVEVSEDFVERIRSGAIIPPQGITHRHKYLVLAGLASEN